MISRVYIEITNICNLHCAFCPPHHRLPRCMSPEEFEHILQEVRKITPYIYLHVQGEPLSHPQFAQILDLCDTYRMQVQLVTNGTLLDRYPSLITHPSLRKVSFSLQSVPFSRNDIGPYLESILAVCETASPAGRPITELRFWRSDGIQDERVRFCLDTIEKRYALQYAKRKNSFTPMKDMYITFANEFEWPENAGEKEGSGTCRGGISQIAILADGTVVPCCLDYEGRIPLGNVLQTPLADILSTERYISLTEGFRKHRITEELCRSCTFRRRFTKP